MSTATVTIVKIGTCTRCERTYRVETAGMFIPCAVCGDDPAYLAAREAFLTEHPRGIYPAAPIIKLTKVRGKVTAKECDEACRSAKRDACSCACGGEHHGEAWGYEW
jgi:hypothetical protein